jgi:hypothetical protein
MRARALDHVVDAWIINAPARTSHWLGKSTTVGTSQVENLISTYINDLQVDGGRWGGADYMGTGSLCQKSFMAGMFNLSLLRYYYHVNARSDIPAAVKANNQWTWENAYTSIDDGFAYVSHDMSVGPEESTAAEPALNPLMAHSYAWSWAYDSDTSDRDRFDLMSCAFFNTTHSDPRALYDDVAPLYGAKQFDQAFFDSFRAWRWRAGELETVSSLL